MDIVRVDNNFLERVKALRLPEREEASPYVVLSIHGDGVRAPEKWNAKIYRNSKGGLKLVTTDLRTLENILQGRAPEVKQKTLSVDDAGWGFPLGGVLIGATDGKRVEAGLIGVEYFQGERFKEHAYLHEAVHITFDLLKRFNASPDNTMIEICSGYINSESKKALREAGYEVKVVEVTGLLQADLEHMFKQYVESLGYHAYFDPKETHDARTPFLKVIEWINEKPQERMKIAKSGWKYFIKK